MIRASIDIGSNSVLLLVAEVDANGKMVNEILNLANVTSLGKDLDKNGVFCEDSINLTYDVLKKYTDEIKKLNINLEDVLVTATEASRVAKNAVQFFEKIKNNLGLNVFTISGSEEAFYTAFGVVSSLISEINENLIIMDIGGASTELISIKTKPFEIVTSVSFPIGSVRATDWIKENNYKLKTENIFSQNIEVYKTKSLICVAGTMTTLAAMYLGLKEFDDKKIDGLKIPFHEFKMFAMALQYTNIDEVLLNFPFVGKRAKTVAAGALVAKEFGEKLNINVMIISTKGLRYGVLLKGEIHGQK
jgi:exopolyphosphatase/guanosine-5'-triphosphate,3'-diphosphate pyrophosphatase